MVQSGKMCVLTSAEAIRSKVEELLSDPEDMRVVCVAFVGKDGSGLLPSAVGIKLYCWPRPGGTNPYGVEELLRAGVNVSFVDRLHCKIYWSKKNGALIGSANLTSNGLLDGGLTEAMVFVPPNTFEIDAFVRTFIEIPNFERKLKWLHRAHVRFQQRNEMPRQGPAAKPMSFDQWIQNRRPDCLLAGYKVNCEAPKDALKQLEQETGSTSHAAFYACASKSALRLGGFTLSFRLRNTPRKLILSDFCWWAPDTFTQTVAEGWHECPYVFFAKRLKPNNTQPPFDCTEIGFRRALEETVNRMPEIDWDDVYRPTARFWSRVAKNYLGQQTQGVSSSEELVGKRI